MIIIIYPENNGELLLLSGDEIFKEKDRRQKCALGGDEINASQMVVAGTREMDELARCGFNGKWEEKGHVNLT